MQEREFSEMCGLVMFLDSWKEKCETERLSQSSFGREHRTKPAILMQQSLNKCNFLSSSFSAMHQNCFAYSYFFYVHMTFTM